MKIDDTLSAVFDTPKIVKITEHELIENETGEIIQTPVQRIEDDYDKTRGNLHELLVKGQEALNAALEVAKQSEHPRAFEVVGNLMKQLADINQQLMDIHQQKAKLDAPSAKEGGAKVTNNAIFVGSTSELNKLIQNMTKGE
jgi:hypothetical protein